MVSFVAVYQHVVVHWRVISLLMILACFAFLIVRFGEDIRFVLIGFALLLIFIASQIFWIGRILDLVDRFIPGEPRRASLALMAGLVYLFVFLYS